MNAITEIEFDEVYKPKINHILRAEMDLSIADEDICSYGGTMYETYGDELNYICSLITGGKSNHIWTVVEGDDGDLIIIAGYHFINRMGYIVTKKGWENSTDWVEDK